MPDFESTLKYLYGLQTRGIKLGLQTIHRLLSTVGDPHKEFPSVHIAGTNGKGSTAAMIAAALTASGYRTGLYTSPHLMKFTERIRINGKEISESTVAQYVQTLKKEIEKTKATFFEATTAIAFQYFADEKVDIAVVETGLGGRLDATNVIVPLLSIITSIGLDHEDLLGKKFSRITREKGGIIKRNVPCLVGEMGQSEFSVLQRIAKRKNAQLKYLPRITSVRIRSHSLNDFVLDVQTPSFFYRNIRCSFPGTFQKNNAALALSAIDELKNKGFSRLTEASIRNGIANIRRYSGLRGRMEIVSNRPLVIVDVAHNPDAVRALVKALRNLFVEKMVVVFGVMKDKDMRNMIPELLKISRMTIAVAPQMTRSMEPESIVEMIHEFGGKCVRARSVSGGTRLAFREVRNHEGILITGSHYVVGEYLQTPTLSPPW